MSSYQHPRGAVMILQDTEGRIHLLTAEWPHVDINFAMNLKSGANYTVIVDTPRLVTTTFDSYEDFQASWSGPSWPSPAREIVSPPEV